MRYFLLKPEVAGGFGPRTLMLDQTARPPMLKRFNYEFSGWLGDSLLTTVACFIVTQQLSEKLTAGGFTGFSLGTVEITKSNEFMELYPEKVLPCFVWLKVHGKAGVDDFGIATDRKFRLVISERVLDILKESTLNHCEIQPF